MRLPIWFFEAQAVYYVAMEDIFIVDSLLDWSKGWTAGVDVCVGMVFVEAPDAVLKFKFQTSLTSIDAGAG